MIDLTNIREDRDVIEPFAERLLARVRERHPAATLEDISLFIEVSVPGSAFIGQSAATRFRRLLADIDREGVVL